jgi:hypothetical protein
MNDSKSGSETQFLHTKKAFSSPNFGQQYKEPCPDCKPIFLDDNNEGVDYCSDLSLLKKTNMK